MSLLFLSFIELIFAWNVPLVSLIFLKKSQVFPILLFFSVSPCYSLELCIQLGISCPPGEAATTARSETFSNCSQPFQPVALRFFSFLFYFFVLGVSWVYLFSENSTQGARQSAKVSKASCLGEDTWTSILNSRVRVVEVEVSSALAALWDPMESCTQSDHRPSRRETPNMLKKKKLKKKNPKTSLPKLWQILNICIRPTL